MADKTTHQQQAPERLSEQLRRLQQALRQHLESQGLEAPEEPEHLLAVLKLAPGMDLDTWREITERLDLQEWVALPMNGELGPYIQDLHETIVGLARHANRDSLTGLGNRRYFEESLHRELDRCFRDRCALSVALLEVDDYDELGARHGAEARDAALVGLAEVLERNKRVYDLAARIGPDRFAMVFPGSGLIRTQGMLSRLMPFIREIEIRGDEPAHLTCSVGVASIRGRRPRTVEDILNMAGEAVEKAKSLGKDQVAAAPLPELREPDSRSLVHSSEKQFLFTGGK
jgi:diguanylate cyclase (GGDEF)-like protein